MSPARNTETAAPLIPPNSNLNDLAAAARRCRACPLWEHATQTVFGEGSPGAQVVLVGEVPGDREDKTGHPFVGPAGALLDKALTAAGIDRGKTYVTNAVKHFKWESHGKRRLHKKPNAREIAACRPWLEAELGILRPEVVIALGATAAQALLGKDFRITRDRGKLLKTPTDQTILTTAHPSSILRVPDPDQRQLAQDRLIADLKVAQQFLKT